jgi:hypothetical protein
MSDTESILHIRLDEGSLRVLKDRARLRQLDLSAYVAMILRYRLLLEHEPTPALPQPPASPGQDIYFTTPLPLPLRSQLARRSDQSPHSLAAFVGIIITGFLDRFDRDPGDLEMISGLAERLDHQRPLTDTDLETVIRLAAHAPVGRMPIAYQIRWYHARLQPLVPTVHWQGQTLELRTDHVHAILTRIQR